MSVYEVTLAKEVAREIAWEVLANGERVQEKLGENPLLKELLKQLGDQIQKLPRMSLKEVQELETILDFLSKIFSGLEER